MQALSDWFLLLEPRPDRPRLVCFPYAGGGVATFRGWAKGLDDVAEVIVARLPGRETRISEPAISDVLAIATAATTSLRAILQRSSRPFALFGHSLGALVALEVTRLLTQSPGPKPSALFASGHSAPTWQDPAPPIAQLPRERFIAELTNLAGTPPEILAHAELMDLLLPTLRADFAAAEGYTRPPGPPIDLPLFVYAGEGDEDTPPEALSGWADETSRVCVTRMFEGEHFFVQSAPEQVWDALRRDLGSVTDAASRSGFRSTH